MTDPQTCIVAIDDIAIVGGNPNRMEPAMFERLKRVIEKVGFLQPVLISENPGPKSAQPYVLVDGEHRLRALRALGRTEVPAIVVEAGADLVEALRIGMNRMRGEMSLTAIANTMHTLMDEEDWSLDDLEVTGFGDNEIKGLLAAMNDDIFAEGFEETTVTPEKPKKFSLSLSFENEADRARVRAAILDAAGEDGNLVDGIITIVENL